MEHLQFVVTLFVVNLVADALVTVSTVSSELCKSYRIMYKFTS